VNPPALPNPMEYNAADQLTRWPNVHQYDYDGAGNLISQWSDPRGASPQKTYEYTPANLLSEVVHTGAGTSSMTWDADGNRVSFTSSTGGTWQFVYDTTAGIPAVIEEHNGSDPVYCIREPDGELIARVDNGSIAYYHFDALGSTRVLTDATGTVTDTYAYDAWGNLMARTGTTTQPYQFVGELGYHTHWQDAHLTLLQLGIRFYDPQVGRFGQRDPAAEWLSHYPYAADNPQYLVDPDGSKVKRPDWSNILKCIAGCGIKCMKDDHFDKCYLPCIGKCVGKEYINANCGAFLCWLANQPWFPKRIGNQIKPMCTPDKKDPCPLSDEDPGFCIDCCGLKYYCCLMTTAANAWFKCKSVAERCLLNCNSTSVNCR